MYRVGLSWETKKQKYSEKQSKNLSVGGTTWEFDYVIYFNFLCLFFFYFCVCILYIFAGPTNQSTEWNVMEKKRNVMQIERESV